MPNQFIDRVNPLLQAEGFAAHSRPAATAEDLQQLQVVLKRNIPSELQRFYLTYGGLGMNDLPSAESGDQDICDDSGNEDDESDDRLPKERPGCYRPTLVPSVQLLLKELQATERWARLDSMGIVDWLRYQWDNDRPEFDEEPPETLLRLNERYIGFGMRRFGNNSARHLYMDQQGRCGFVDYHQDNYADLWDLFLDPMLDESPATMSLEQALDSLLTNHSRPAPF